MLEIEKYIGRPNLASEGGEWQLNLAPSLQTNLNHICELVLLTLEPLYCRLICHYQNINILAAQSGVATAQMLADTQSFRQSLYYRDQLNAVDITDANWVCVGEGYHRVSVPITLCDAHDGKVPFGYLELYYSQKHDFLPKDISTLNVIVRDITSHLEQHKHIIESNQARELDQLVSEYNKDWIYVKDAKFRFIYANQAFISLFPKDKQQDVIGNTNIKEPSGQEAHELIAQDKAAFKEGQYVSTQDVYTSAGQRMVYETIKRRFYNTSGKPHILCICRDITERENLIRQLKHANDDLDDFTHIASHDLKAPLNAIRRLLGWIEEDCHDMLPAESRENLRLVVSRANRMYLLLEDLLTFAKIGREDTTTKRIDLGALVGDLTPLLDAPNELNLNVAAGELTVALVPFKTIMLNLLGNAVKHNDKANPQIEVGLREIQHFYVVSIKDNGPGIDPKNFERIFQLFQTLKSRDEVEGSGIGLSVVLKHLNQYGGRIEVDSDGENGTTFTVYWPKPKHGAQQG